MSTRPVLAVLDAGTERVVDPRSTAAAPPLPISIAMTTPARLSHFVPNIGNPIAVQNTSGERVPRRPHRTLTVHCRVGRQRTACGSNQTARCACPGRPAMRHNPHEFGKSRCLCRGSCQNFAPAWTHASRGRALWMAIAAARASTLVPCRSEGDRGLYQPESRPARGRHWHIPDSTVAAPPREI